MNKEAYIYIMASKYNTTLYIGMTNDLQRRVGEHKAHINKGGFSSRYNCEKLVYFEDLGSFDAAIEREKSLKNWKREWKNNLIKESNPEWNDLSESIGVTEEYVQAITDQYKQEREG